MNDALQYILNENLITTLSLLKFIELLNIKFNQLN